MGNIKNIFTTADFENITGIKAHTIRIWEKRYKLFQPEKAARNIRYYDLAALQKLLNIALLQKQGYKISKIANLTDTEIAQTASTFVNAKIEDEYLLSQLKLAMFGFDTALFNQIYQQSLEKNTFKTVFIKIFAPFLYFLGELWHTHSIHVAHEHFITNLMYQKIQVEIEKLPINDKKSDKPTFIFFLPEEEMHEIGLLFLNYELKQRGFYTIYLGRSIPFDDLSKLKTVAPLIHWVSVFTMTPITHIAQDYLTKVDDLLLIRQHQFWAIGHHLKNINTTNFSNQIKLFPSIKAVVEKL
ncbi:MAG: MerR family transcriptional regulator [Saprospiraceae bacterium]